MAVQKRKGSGGRKLRTAIKDLQQRALLEAPRLVGVQPEEAIQECLETSLAAMRWARNEMDALEAGEHWIVNEETGTAALAAITKVEERERNNTAYIAARMMDLDIAGRRANAAEALAEVLAPALQAMFVELRLTKAQKEKAPELMRKHLGALEGVGHEKS